MAACMDTHMMMDVRGVGGMGDETGSHAAGGMMEVGGLGGMGAGEFPSGTCGMDGTGGLG